MWLHTHAHTHQVPNHKNNIVLRKYESLVLHHELCILKYCAYNSVEKHSADDVWANVNLGLPNHLFVSVGAHFILSVRRDNGVKHIKSI